MAAVRLLRRGRPPGEHPHVTMGTGELMTTGQAAILLRVSRGHVADLCLRGLLPYVSAGF